MVFHGTYLRIADNSGGRYAMSIKLLGYYKHFTPAKIGNVLVIVIKKVRHKLKGINEHSIHNALLVRTKKEFYRKTNGNYLKFHNNDIVLLDKNNNPIGTRVIGPVPLELRKLGWSRIMAIAEGIV